MAFPCIIIGVRENRRRNQCHWVKQQWYWELSKYTEAKDSNLLLFVYSYSIENMFTILLI